MFRRRDANAAFFGKHIDPQCAYCAHSARQDGKEEVRCQLGRSWPAGGRCRRYRYDPLRRVPRPRPPLPAHEAKEFKL